MSDTTSTTDYFRDLLIEQLGLSSDKVISAKDSLEDLGADSLDTVEILMAVESQFSIDISDDEADKLKTFGQWIDWIDGRIDDHCHD